MSTTTIFTCFKDQLIHEVFEFFITQSKYILHNFSLHKSHWFYSKSIFKAVLHFIRLLLFCNMTCRNHQIPQEPNILSSLRTLTVTALILFQPENDIWINKIKNNLKRIPSPSHDFFTFAFVEPGWAVVELEVMAWHSEVSLMKDIMVESRKAASLKSLPWWPVTMRVENI